ncbi:hypothetical protein L208DRAFT_1427192 [Tricholoma matsutake]|nr:hypothetical protein L208DRAFT_1427192 [Tricholoma matsutake 945]
MARSFCITGIFFLLTAFVLSFLTSISLPFLPALDITRTHFGNRAPQSGLQGMTELRNDHRTCAQAGHGYKFDISNQDKSSTITIGPSWTRGLALHPVATVVTFVALLLSLSQHATIMLFASLTSFLAAQITLLAFACDIALFVYLRQQVNRLHGVVSKTTPSAGFWLTFVSFILLLLAGLTVCLGRRRDRMAGATEYPAINKPKKSWFRRS